MSLDRSAAPLIACLYSNGHPKKDSGQKLLCVVKTVSRSSTASSLIDGPNAAGSQRSFYRGVVLTVVILTEKPSVARDIAGVLGLKNKANGYLFNEFYKVTWAYGHLVSLAEPHQIKASWKSWRAHELPMIPDSWPLEIIPKTADQFAIVTELLNARDTKQVICATDAGREGELIFRYIYEKSGCSKPVKRLWISSLTPEAIKKGLAELRDSREFEGLADSARARSRADWLVGMNLSRGYSLSYGENLTVGRVQTPTLAMLVEREHAIQNFVVEDYLVIQASFRHEKSESYQAYYFDPNDKGEPSNGQEKKAKAKYTGLVAKRFKPDDPSVQLICQRVSDGKIYVKSLKDKAHSLAPPEFYDLTELQRHANRIFGFSADKTLTVAQSLYEKYKLITYPRTDSRHVSTDIGNGLGQLASAVAGRYPEILEEHPLKIRPLTKRYVDNKRVTDHHAILPTGQTARTLPADEERLFDMICRRLLMAYMADHRSVNTEAILTSHDPTSSKDQGKQPVDHFFARGRRILELGWKRLDFHSSRAGEQEKLLPDAMREGARQELVKLGPIKRQTQPPPRLNDASLLTAMETAGSTLDDKELSDAMREHGLGTPATRSNIIENLLKRQYVSREKRNFRATDKGIRLVAMVHEEIKSPSLTGSWELRLRQIRQGKFSLNEFSKSIIEFVKRTTLESLKSQPKPVSQGPHRKDPPSMSSRPEPAPQPDQQRPRQKASSDLTTILSQRFGFNQFRPHQEAVCRDVVRGLDTLLVMPTGAGKSLCYQLPGLALGGPTLVVSPLIALMDDQVAKLRDMGMAAAAIHSGKSRDESRQLCRLSASGQLDFLFVAPERLGVPGFVPFLTQHKPQLIAIDEAHCISHWGHDFRYDYRRLTERLAPLRPAVVIAMTATATTRVQQDILQQLALEDPACHIHGFRRTNIAIENVEVSKKDRHDTVAEILKNPDRLPAIVYAPTRKEAENTAASVGQHFKCHAYHAGMDPASRNRVQEAFQADELDVIVATTAFGMGIDKPNIRTVIHMAVPGSLEGYYQEIGRAGRDGKPSRAVLLYSFIDQKTHEYFHKQNYPDIKELKEVFKKIPKAGIQRADIHLSIPPDDLDGHLGRLVMIGALRCENGGWYFREQSRGWEAPYEEQKQYRYNQLTIMNRYVNEGRGCRMLRLMAHFGDEDAAGESCGICDICAPANCLVKSLRPWTSKEINICQKIIDRLDLEQRPVALGTLFRDIADPLGLKRNDYNKLMEALIHQEFLASKQASFNKGGDIINYQTVHLTVSKDSIPWSSLKLNDKQSSSKSSGPRKTKARQGAVVEKDVDQDLLERLRKWRKLEAQKRSVPAFCILPDKSLISLAAKKPKDQPALLDVHGIGQVKADQYGSSLISIIESW